MKRLLFVLLSILLLFSCTQPTTPKQETKTVYVYDSAWNLILKTDVVVSSGKTVTMSDVETQVATYNATNNDDQYFLETEEVPIEEAPNATAYIVRNDTYAVMYQATVERTDLVDRRFAWDATVACMADPETKVNIPCTLFVDKIPELPATPVVDDYVKWAIYIIDNTGAIWFEVHETSEDSFQNRYGACLATIQLLDQSEPALAPHTVLTRQLYIPPTVATTP